MISLSVLKKSFTYAFRGIARVAREEQSFRIQLLVALVVVVLVFVVDFTGVERALLALAIAFVLVLELMNSVAERMIDMFKPRIHHYAQDAKDIMAGAVLIASCGAVAVAAAIAWPHLAVLLGVNT